MKLYWVYLALFKLLMQFLFLLLKTVLRYFHPHQHCNCCLATLQHSHEDSDVSDDESSLELSLDCSGMSLCSSAESESKSSSGFGVKYSRPLLRILKALDVPSENSNCLKRKNLILSGKHSSEKNISL